MSERIGVLIELLKEKGKTDPELEHYSEVLEREWANASRRVVQEAERSLVHAADMLFGINRESFQRIRNAELMLLPDKSNPVMLFMSERKARALKAINSGLGAQVNARIELEFILSFEEETGIKIPEVGV